MRSLVILLIAAALATAVGVAGSQFREHFQAGEGMSANATDPNRDYDAEAAAIRAVLLKNTLLVDVILGAAMGLFLGAAGAMTARGRAVVAAVMGLVAGAAAGAAGAYVGRAFADLVQFPTSVAAARTPIIHACLWILVAAALAISIGLATRRKLAVSLFGRFFVYSIIAVAIYPVIAAIAFPFLNSDQPIPEGLANTGLWIAIPSTLFAIAIAQATRASAQAPVTENVAAT
jgi:hypothetical protein